MRERYQLRQWERKADTIRRKIWALNADMPDEGDMHDSIMNAQIEMDDLIAQLERKLRE
jgi:hypothetical protein